MRRVVIYGAVGVAVATALVLFAEPARTRFNTLRSTVATIAGDTGDVMSGASYQRFQARREAVATMQADLRALARAESAYIADSGRPTVNPPAEYWRGPSARNVGPFIRIERDGWRAMMTNSRTPMRCVLFARFDTVTNTYNPGDPDCRTESGESWDAILAADAASQPPVPVTPEATPLTPVATPPQPRSPRRHRDWGRVNNTPPPVPWVLKNQCPGEYCSLGRWAACSSLVARREKRAQAQPAFTLQPGEEFTALTGDVHVDVPGMVVFRHPYSNPGDEGGPPVDSIRFSPADTLYVLNGLSEGYLMWYYRGRADTGYQFWAGDPFMPGEAEPGDTAVMIRSPQTVWWVRVRNRAGQEGWVIYDYRKMARDDRMDERSRCLR